MTAGVSGTSDVATLVMAGHGARDGQWSAVLADLAGRVRRMRPGRRVRLSFLELSTPPLADVLAATVGPVVVVPMLLAGGYHAHVDLPAVVARVRPDARVAGPLGPHPLLTSVLARRLAQAGLRPGDAVVLGAAGSSDPAALDDVRAAARLLSVRLSRPVTAAFAAGGTPTLADALTRARSAPRVAVASYLLAPGHFHNRLAESSADLVAAPLGADDDLAALVWARFDEAAGTQPSSRSSRTMSSALSSRDGSESAPVNIS
ncbi:cobalamin biosynthesis protein CbiX [Acrocarpospora phusangensis]|uniref:Cobalamin biosynthesis protein CbiX n=1 Tax=Acrocarpospora phusangensis TaxID=1070424 RepID=A0A919Q9Y9_9ACTN|nr:sirohydrochlorin chelatase [Acrocarpospora phusangensis]GIH24758.1 cobalamin biosynthesis protein CbiX [Acrocarpospora phusangensis]